ncbi:hypothetical protein NL108_017943 [Boleophthalmus pectinirostris]|nr:hypothetical protein NL108_017943 [Boleophthalmus pectinirostris]
MVDLRVSGRPPPAVVDLRVSGRRPPAVVDLRVSGRRPPAVVDLRVSGRRPPAVVDLRVSGRPPPAVDLRVFGRLRHRPRPLLVLINMFCVGRVGVSLVRGGVRG